MSARAYALTEELLAAEKCWGMENHSLWGCNHWDISYTTVDGHISMDIRSVLLEINGLWERQTDRKKRETERLRQRQTQIETEKWKRYVESVIWGELEGKLGDNYHHISLYTCIKISKISNFLKLWFGRWSGPCFPQSPVPSCVQSRDGGWQLCQMEGWAWNCWVEKLLVQARLTSLSC